jgi:Tol biopolymer transport system component
VAVDDRPWGTTFGDAVLTPVFSPDGARVAAAVKDGGRWTICVDGQRWPEDYAMVWDPVFSPDGRHVAAKVEHQGRLALVIDGRRCTAGLDGLWRPAFSPDGSKVLVKSVESQRYTRQVVPLSSMLG